MTTQAAQRASFRATEASERAGGYAGRFRSPADKLRNLALHRAALEANVAALALLEPGDKVFLTARGMSGGIDGIAYHSGQRDYHRDAVAALDAAPRRSGRRHIPATSAAGK